jgi:DnaJ-class molecular chaperone
MQHPKSQSAWLSGKTGFKYPSVIDNNPFDILGISKGSSYKNVRRKFVELAMKHHPDVSENDDGDVEEFVRLREAFETIRESEDGTARLTKDGETGWSDDEFQAWFHEETGHQDVMFRMDLNTRKEVINMANIQSQGGLDKGGMWEMARVMAQQEESLKKQKKNFKSSLGIGSEISSEETSSRRRRKRRK